MGLAAPAEAVARIGVLGLDEAVKRVLVKQANVAVAAAVEHDLLENGDVACAREQASMAGHLAHHVEGLGVVALPLDGLAAHVGERDGAVARVAVELGGRAVVLGESMAQGLVRRARKAERPIDLLLEVVVEPHAHDGLNDEAQQHVVHVRVARCRARCVLERRGDDLLESLVAALGEQGGVGVAAGNDPVERRVVVRVVIARVCGESRLVLEQLGDGELVLAGSLGTRQVAELRKVVVDSRAQVDLPLAGKLLECHVAGEHLGVAGHVKERLVRDGRAPGSRDGRAVLLVGAHGAIVASLDDGAVLHHNELGAREARLDLGLYDLVEKLEGRVACPGGRVVSQGGVGNAQLERAAALGQAADLQVIVTVDRGVGDAHAVPRVCGDAVERDAHAVDEHAKRLRGLAAHEQRALPLEADEGPGGVRDERLVVASRLRRGGAGELELTGHGAAPSHAVRGWSSHRIAGTCASVPKRS